jgi:acetyl esterase
MKRLIACAALVLTLPLAANLTAKKQQSSASSTAPYVRPDVQVYLEAMQKNPRPPMNDQTISMIRKIPPEVMANMMSAAEAPMATLAVDKNLTMPGPGGTMNLRLFDTRTERGPGPVLVFYHGGGFVVGNIITHASLAAEMARQLDVPVVSVEYRLAPENKWPAAPDDAEAAARWIADNGAALGRDVTGLILSGDSAGGTLTLTTAIALRDKPASKPLKLIIPLYPMADASKVYPSMTNFSHGFGLDRADMDYFEKAYGADKNNWRHSALLADLHGMPPTVLATASLDPLHDGGVAFVKKLKTAHVPVRYYEAKGNIHGYTTYRKAIPSAQDDLTKILALAKKFLAKN